MRQHFCRPALGSTPGAAATLDPPICRLPPARAVLHTQGAVQSSSVDPLKPHCGPTHKIFPLESGQGVNKNGIQSAAFVDPSCPRRLACSRQCEPLEPPAPKVLESRYRTPMIGSEAHINRNDYDTIDEIRRAQCGSSLSEGRQMLYCQALCSQRLTGGLSQ